MKTLARWHIWLGWTVAVPVLIWLASGLFMAARPIDEVRGTALRIDRKPPPITLTLNQGSEAVAMREGRLLNQRGRDVLIATLTDGSRARFDLSNQGMRRIAPVDEAEARRAVASEIVGGANPLAARLFSAAESPFDFRKPVAAWQVTLADGTHVYVGRDSGEIEAVRTRWWRAYDFMWGLHIMDLQTREDTSNVFLWLFGALALGSAAIGSTLMFRRRTRPRG